MSVKEVRDFLISELDEYNSRIIKTKNLLSETELHIKETNYFIDELSGKHSSDLSLSYISEKQKSENLVNEKEALKKFQKLKEKYEDDLKFLEYKKSNFEKYVKALDDNDSSVSNSAIKNSDKNEINNSLEFMKKSIDNYAYIDPNRVVTDFKLFEERVKKVTSN